MNERQFQASAELRINRNILECKYITEVNEDETGGQY
mgnify:CR=1 FL=1